MAVVSRRKIGIIANEFLPNFGGMESYAKNLAECFHRQGYEVHLFTRVAVPALPGIFFHPVLNGHLFHDLRALRRFDMDLWLGINSAYLTLALFKQNVYVVIHGNDFLNPWVRFYFSWMKSSFLWRYKNRIELWLLRCAQRCSLARVKGIIANSHFTKRKFLEIFPGNESRIRVIPPGIEPIFLQEKTGPPADSRQHLLTVARLTKTNRRKNIRSVIEALSALQGRYDFMYSIVGDGDALTDLRAFVAQHGMNERVRLLGALGGEDLKRCYGSASLFILTPTVEKDDVEGFGIVYIEANASGVPVLASRGSGSEDAVQDGLNGFFVAQPDPAQIRQALVDFFDRKIQFDRKQIIEYAQRFTWDNIAQRIEREVFQFPPHPSQVGD